MQDNRWIRAFILYMALAGGNYMIYHLILPIRIFHHVLLFFLFIYWIFSYGLPDTPLLWGLIPLCLVAGLAALLSIDKRVAMESWWHWITNVLLFLMVIQWFRQGRAETVFKYQFAVGWAIVAASALEWLIQPGERVGGPFLLINLNGAYAAALLIPVVAWAGSSSSPRQRWTLGALAVGLALVIVANGSRGAFLSVGVAIAVYATLQRGWARWGIFAAGAVLAVIIGMTLSSAGHRSGDELRMDLWRAGGEMLTENTFGVGPGLFGQAYRQNRSGDDDNMTGAHNHYLNLGAETGALGLAAGAALLLLFLYYALPQQRTMRQNAILASLAGIAAHLLVDNYPSSNFAFLVAVYAAYLVADVRVQWAGWPFLLRETKRLALLAVVIYAIQFFSWDRAQIAFERSLNNGDSQAAADAVFLDPDMMLYRLNLVRVISGPEAALRFDKTLTPETDLAAYGLVGYGRMVY